MTDRHADLYPAVARYGDLDMESFEDYYARWPQALASLPEPIVRDWVHRHWRCFASRWIDLAPHTWRFDLVQFSNEQILAIDHVGKWIEELDAEGVDYVGDFPRARTRLAQYMLSEGTFPVPIIVAKNAGHFELPRSSGQRMKTPLQLIEGHARLACLRGMIHACHPRLGQKHAVWLAHIPSSTGAITPDS